VNGVYGPNNGAPSYFESLFALSVPPGGGSVQVFYTTDYGYIPNIQVCRSSLLSRKMDGTASPLPIPAIQPEPVKRFSRSK
jgi:hypothetical protein